MLRIARTLPAVLAALAAPLPAAERSVGIGSFERLRVDGPFVVTVVTGRSPGARISGGPAAIADVEVRSEGGTLVVRRAVVGRWGEQGIATETGAGAGTGPGAGPVTVALSTPALSGVTLVGGGKVAIDRMKAPRLDLSVTGPGTIALDAADADEVRALLVGSGSLALAGKAAIVRLTSNGPGTIDAARLDAGDLVVRVDGSGQISARARNTAQVTSNGLAAISVAGRPKCTVRALSSVPIACGDPSSPDR